MHPLLLPGTHVVRRGPEQQQAGLDPHDAVLLPGAATSLQQLYEDPAARRTLHRVGLLLDDDRPLRAALPPLAQGDPWIRHTIAATVRRTAGRCPDALAARRTHVISVRRFGHPLGRSLADDLESVCRRAGLRLPVPTAPGPARRGVVPPTPIAVLVGVGEPSRELLDDWLRDAVPHLVVRLVEGRAVVGPFVVPGQTACLRCIDAFLTEQDPAWPLVVEQYSRATRADRADGVPEPVDAALAAVAIGWAARDLEAYSEGSRPSSWSTTTTLHPDLSEITPRQWPAHPHCGCGWA